MIVEVKTVVGIGCEARIGRAEGGRMPYALCPMRYALLIFLLFISACGPTPRPPEPDNLFWPLPPEPPRIHYIQSIYSDDDIGKVYSFSEKLFGKDYIDRLQRPYGVFARGGKIAAADIGMQAVLLFDLAAKRLTLVGGDGTIRYPSAAVVDSAGNVYVADGPGGKIALYTPKGKYKTAFLLKGGKPTGLALNEQRGRLYVTDLLGHRVVVFGLDGKQLFEFGARGDANGQFNMPLDVTVDAQGTVYVLDARNFRVQLFDQDGKFISKFGSAGDGPGFFANPKGIAVDSEGHVYVTDAAFSNFQIFDRAGNMLLSVGNLGPRPGEMHLPAGISIDEHDRIYVADQLNGRIEVFQYLKAE